MSKQVINLGSSPTGIGGDDRRSAWVKAKSNFTELYNWIANAAQGDDVATALPAALPVAKGGTGGATQAAARTGLGLGSSATLNTGSAQGNVAVVGFRGLGIQSLTKASTVNVLNSGFDAYDSTVTSYSPSTYGAMLTMGFPFGDWAGQLFISCTPQSKAWIRGGSQTNAPFYELYTTGNTTRGSGGALSAASPILRIADVSRSERRDLLEQTFEPAGEYGVANDEARGVTVERVDVGVYLISGSLGLALEGWRIQDPCSPDGGRTLGITQSDQDEQGLVTLRLFKQRWTLDDDGEMHLGPGAPIDVPLNSWIDVRLEMPAKPATGAPEELPA